MFEQFIKRVKNLLILKYMRLLHDTWLNAWLEKMRPEIEREIDKAAKLEKQQDEGQLERLRNDLAGFKNSLKELTKKDPQNRVYWYSDKSVIESSIATTEERIREISQRTFEYYRNNCKSKINDIYKNRFENEVWNDRRTKLETNLSEHLDQIQPQVILTHLFTRHPWMLDEIDIVDYNDGLAFQFLSSLLSTDITPYIDHLKNLDRWEVNFKCAAVNVDSLKKRVEGYPLSKVREFYSSHDNQRDEYPSLQTLLNVEFAKSVLRSRIGVKTTNNPNQPRPQLSNHQISRVDLYRYLAKVDASSSTSKRLANDVDSTKVAPLLIDEFKFLSKEQWEHFQTLVVNVKSEENPLWIAMHKKNGKWIAYLPRDTKLCNANEIEQLKNICGPDNAPEIQFVDYTSNVKLNDMEATGNTTWHAVLLVRVLPWLRQPGYSSWAGSPGYRSLDEYRREVPLPLLIQEAWENCTVFGEYVEIIRNAFNKRKPMTDGDLFGLILDQNRKVNQLLDDLSPLNSIINNRVLSRFDNRELEISVGSETIKIASETDSGTRTIEALFLIYHNPLSRLSYPSIEFPTTNAIRELVERDVHLKSFKPSLRNNEKLPDHVLQSYSHPLRCAARNRFLSSVASKYLLDAENDINKRKELWRYTGQQIIQFFQQNGKSINLDFINKVMQFNPAWRENYCDHAQERNGLTETMWSFTQINQMSLKALDCLFDQLKSGYADRWNVEDKEPGPNLPFTLDLSGSITDKPENYIRHLTDKIKNFGTRCYPLFNSLAFILPKPLNFNCQQALIELIHVLHERQVAHPEDASEFSLYNLDITDQNSIDLIRLLKRKADNGLRMLVRIPEWDRASYEQIDNRKSKALYRELQNIVLDNQRVVNYQQLHTNMEKMNKCANGNLDPQIIIDDKLSQRVQSWEGKDVTYPLIVRAPGLQQQLQEQIAQQFEQQTEQEQEQEEEQEQEIVQYGGDLDALITRSNIDAKCQKDWEAIPEDTKGLSGWKKNELSQLFSLWVGSHIDAEHVIERIEPLAVQKIMEHAAKFRLGISRENLPAGFYLARSRNNKSLLLCYHPRREKQDLRARAAAALTLKKANPFTVELHEARTPLEFKGDFRQLTPLNSDINNQQTLWKYLATEDNDEQRLGNARKLLFNLNKIAPPKDDLSTIMQRFDAFDQIQKAEELRVCALLLQDWAKKHRAGGWEKIVFDETSDTDVIRKNLKSFGQLFHHYSIQAPGRNGTEHWLTMANELYKTFGGDHFKIWKKRLLDPSRNWSECLDKPEIDAVALSIATLRSKHSRDLNRQDLATIWWQLVDAHGRTTGHMRYAPLWYAFQKVIDYVEKNKLTINQVALFNYLKNTENFNGNVFLDRLYRVLNNASRQLNHETIQQDILDNIDRINWCHNGYFYASRYESYPYWHTSLELAEFRQANKENTRSYRVNWDRIADHSMNNPATQALRFASHRMQMPVKEFAQLEKLVNQCFKQGSAPLLRFFIACNATGLDKLTEIDPAVVNHVLTEVNPADTVVHWINEQILLDGELTPGDLQIRWEDLPNFVKAINHIGLNNVLNFIQTHKVRALDFINAYGRALQCQRYCCKNSKLPFEEILKIIINEKNAVLKASMYSNFNNCPWTLIEYQCQAIDEIDNNEVSLLRRQLRSIDFSKTTWLPASKDILDAYMRIINAAPHTRAGIRQTIASEWLQKGCAISYLDTPFRKLNERERQDAFKYLDNHLKLNFKEQNSGLCKKLIDHLAVKAGPTIQKDIEDLIKQLVLFDNKAHYNELGPIVGLLLSKANDNGRNRTYSVPLLTLWLKTFLDESTFENQHYPVNLLSELLTYSSKNQDSSGLLCDNMFKLRDKVLTEVPQQRIRGLAKVKLPNQYKATLVRLYFQSQDSSRSEEDMDFVKTAEERLCALQQAEADPHWLNGICKLLGSIYISSVGVNQRKLILEQLTKQWKNLSGVDQSLSELWQRCQIQLLGKLAKNELPPNNLLDFFAINEQPGSQASSCYIKIILTLAMSENFDEDVNDIRNLKDKLSRRNQNDLRKLAEYYATDPRPSMKFLNKLLDDQHHCDTAEKLIHHFETVEQGLNPDGTRRRHYSVSDEDRANLLRIAAGFKRKGIEFISEKEANELVNLLYYTNSYTQAAQLHKLPMGELQNLLYTSLIQHKNTLDKEDNHHTAARMLACMREILLRKSGKWANHTQMLNLLYAALYNDNSVIYQVRTGQGKSIIAILRTAYLALNGSVVDIFSAKESLARRDHEDFAPVLSAMGISHAYIAANSPAKDYQTNSAIPGVGEIGAINYSTVGNFSLFHSTHAWKGETFIKLDAENRVAFVDEADHVLMYDKTQFNYSDNGDSDAVYNMDEWVYRITYAYYLQNKDDFKMDEAGVLLVSRNRHLKALCEALQKHVRYAPKQSLFFNKYIIPALGNDPESVKKRDEQLMHQLTAAHIAHDLKEGVNFCLRPEHKTVSGMVIDTRSAKVLIGNQIQQNSTYSETVHQYLHVRLNQEAAERGQSPDFFVDPVSQIAISLNTRYLLKQLYKKIEGCTGTSGNEDDRKTYSENYDLKHVVKLPTHETIQTTFLPTIYCDSEEEKIDKLVGIILDNRAKKQQPILLTCRDDIAVKHTVNKVKEKLKSLGHDPDDLAKFVTEIKADTNDSGKAEKEVVKPAGKKSADTFSSRLGRGTDIKPEVIEGLRVQRTYPAISNVEKQERGRQGRNGAQGICQDIIDYSAVRIEFDKYAHHQTHGKRLFAILEEQQKHLKNKLEKHRANTSTKFAWLDNDPALQEKYLHTRSVEQLKYELKQQQEQFLRRKELLIATLSGNVMNVLRQLVNDKAEAQRLKEAWLDCSKKIESLWNARLTGRKGESEEVYKEFFRNVHEEWKRLCGFSLSLNPLLLLEMSGTEEPLADDAATTKKYLLKNMALWKEKYDKAKLSPNDNIQLTALRATLKKVVLRHHTDKNIAKNQSEESVDLGKMALELLRVVGDCMIKISGPVANTSHTSAAETSASSAPNGSPSNGALIKHENPVIKQQKYTVMPVVLAFYQQWVSGAESFYFDVISGAASREVLSAVYGVNQRHLNHLYSTLYAASVFNENYPLNAKKQSERRQLVFETFRVIMQNPSGYCITCDSLANTIDRLMKHPDDSRDKHILECLNSFFANSWLSTQTPSKLTPDDLVKTSRLLALVLDIVLVYKGDPALLAQFVNKLTSVICNHFWADFNDDFAQQTKLLFTGTTEVTTLFMTRTNEADLGHLLDLNLKNVKKDKAVAKRRLESLMSYIGLHTQKLGEFPQTIRPLFDLMLANKEEINPRDVPAPNCLPKLGPDLQGRFWSFLSQRQHITKENCQRLIHMLKDFPGANENFIRQVFEPLVALPFSIPLDYIINVLKFTPGQSQFDDCHVRLMELKQAGELFDAFARGKEEPARAGYQDHFNAMSLSDNTLFLNLVKKYNSIPEDNLARIQQAFRERKINGKAELAQLLELEKALLEFPAHLRTAIFTTLNDGLRSLNRDELVARIVQLQTFVNTTKAKIKNFDDATCDWLFNDTWVRGQQTSVIIDSMNVLEEIQKSNVTRAVKTHYLQQQRSHEAQESLNKRYLDFLRLIGLPKNKRLGDDTIQLLFNAYIVANPSQIETMEQLDEALKVTRKARELQTNQNDSDIFSEQPTQANRSTRQNIMQYLEHGLLDLGQNFKDFCYVEYKKLAAKLTKLDVDAINKMKPEKRPDVYKKHYQEIVRFTREIKHVATHPFSRIVPERENIDQRMAYNTRQIKSEYNNYFTQQRNNYNSFWFKAAERRRQADDLFNTLSGLCTRDDNETDNNRGLYYERICNQIWVAQRDILTSDRNTTRNGKGYSRLYDITMQMFITVARDCLADREVAYTTKQRLNTLLKEQFRSQYSMLFTRLQEPSTVRNPLTAKISPIERWHPGSTEIARFNKLLATTPKEAIPAHLQYVVNNLRCLIDLSETATANDNHHLRLN